MRSRAFLPRRDRIAPKTILYAAQQAAPVLTGTRGGHALLTGRRKERTPIGGVSAGLKGYNTPKPAFVGHRTTKHSKSYVGNLLDHTRAEATVATLLAIATFDGRQLAACWPV